MSYWAQLCGFHLEFLTGLQLGLESSEELIKLMSTMDSFLLHVFQAGWIIWRLARYPFTCG